MRGKRAKFIRKMVYGEEFSPKIRKYSTKKVNVTQKDKNTGKLITIIKEFIIADPKRRLYQTLKREYVRG